MYLRKFMETLFFYFNQSIARLLPMCCCICGFNTKNSLNLCDVCLNNLPSLPHHCKRCAAFLPSTDHHLICGHCLSSPPPFDRVLTLFPYEMPISQLITQLKFQYQLIYATLFSTLFLKAISNQWYADHQFPDLIIAVPLHAKRLRERGFNQSLEMIKPAAKKLKIPIDSTGITRTKHTLPQHQLLAEARAENVKNAFVAQRDYQGLFVAVVDDVITTGHTIRALCQVLRECGATKIDVWCCARR